VSAVGELEGQGLAGGGGGLGAVGGGGGVGVGVDWPQERGYSARGSPRSGPWEAVETREGGWRWAIAVQEAGG